MGRHPVRNNGDVAKGGEEVRQFRRGKQRDRQRARKDGKQRGNVIFRFMLEEPLPRLCDSYQLPRDRETQGRGDLGGQEDK